MKMRKIPHVRAGDPITDTLFNEVSERLEMFANLKSGSPYVRLWETPNGKAIALAFPARTFGLLSGSSSPYAWSEVRDGPGGTWVSMPNGDSGTAYEVNNLGSLGGKVVELDWTAVGDWRFQWVGFAPPTVAWTFRVTGCLSGTGIAGATIELRQSGTLIDSCTTSSGGGGTTLGNCTMTVPAGTYDVTITGPSGRGFASQTFAAPATTMTIRALSPDSSHVCVSACNFPIPKTLFTTDGLGTTTLTWDSSLVAWVGTATQTANVRLVVPGSPITCTASGTCTVTYTLSNTLVLTLQWDAACCVLPGNGYYYAADGSLVVQHLSAAGSRTALVCDPFSLTFNIPGQGSGFAGCAFINVFGVITPGGSGSDRTQTVTP